MDWHIIATMFIFLITHIIATVWWASSVNTTLKVVLRDVGDLVLELRTMKNMYVRKEDHSKDIAIIEKNQEAVWKKLDSIIT